MHFKAERDHRAQVERRPQATQIKDLTLGQLAEREERRRSVLGRNLRSASGDERHDDPTHRDGQNEEQEDEAGAAAQREHVQYCR